MRIHYANQGARLPQDPAEIRAPVHPASDTAPPLAQVRGAPGAWTLRRRHPARDGIYHITDDRGLTAPGAQKFSVGDELCSSSGMPHGHAPRRAVWRIVGIARHITSPHRHEDTEFLDA